MVAGSGWATGVVGRHAWVRAALNAGTLSETLCLRSDGRSPRIESEEAAQTFGDGAGSPLRGEDRRAARPRIARKAGGSGMRDATATLRIRAHLKPTRSGRHRSQPSRAYAVGAQRAMRV